MDERKLININIVGSKLLPTPRQLHDLLPASEKSLKTVLQGRRVIQEILNERDKRLVLIVGPCSIHDPQAALEYAERLKKLADQVSEKFFVVMRVYFEKPRTTTGWKGLINDPDLNDSFHIEKGLKRARQLLLQITEIGLPTATEALDPIIPQYLSELICWYAIGARTTESQTHREMASGLSAPVGFKNGTDGNIDIAINGMKSVLTPHHFLGIDAEGRTSVFQTRGNSDVHIVLRGGNRPNWDSASIRACEEALETAGLRKKILIDCSHGNSGKDYRKQPAVFEAVLQQVKSGTRSIIGMMLESHLFEGNQAISSDPKKMKYGVSITDACISWEETERLILKSA